MAWWRGRFGRAPAAPPGPPSDPTRASPGGPSVPEAWMAALEQLATRRQSGPAALEKARQVLAEAARHPPPRASLAPAAALCIGAALAGEPCDEAEVAPEAGCSTLALREAVEWLAGRIDVGILLPEGPAGRRRLPGMDPPRGDV